MQYLYLWTLLVHYDVSDFGCRCLLPVVPSAAINALGDALLRGKHVGTRSSFVVNNCSCTRLPPFRSFWTLCKLLARYTPSPVAAPGFFRLSTGWRRETLPSRLRSCSTVLSKAVLIIFTTPVWHLRSSLASTCFPAASPPPSDALFCCDSSGCLPCSFHSSHFCTRCCSLAGWI